MRNALNTMKFRNKAVWITGASSGIGEALAIEFTGAGARLVLSSRDTAELDRVADRCSTIGAVVRPYILPFDIGEFGCFPETVGKVLAHTGGIDILVNNAGVGQRSTALSCSSEVVQRIMNVNFLGPVFLTQRLLPSMLGRGNGRIVVISSILGKIHLPGRSAYSASKHALQGYFATLRTELHKTGIGVTVICPGWIATNISKNALTEKGVPFQHATRAASSKMSAQHFARKALKVIGSGKDDAVIGGLETSGISLYKFFPRLYEYYVRKQNKFICSRPT